MGREEIQRLRNIGIIAHIDAGKTTTTERILHRTGVSHRVGTVDEGTAVMDWMAQERERGITITSAVTTAHWHDHILNIVDTPGHVDFTAEVQRSLRILDGAIVVICAVGGVEPQSEKVWHQASEYRVPRIVFVNKLDRSGADFEAALADMRKRLGNIFVPLVVPLGRDEGYGSVLDLPGNRLLTWDPDNPDAPPAASPVPKEYADIRAAGFERIVEAAGDADDSILDEFLETGDVDRDHLVPALRKAVLTGEVHPVLAGSALRGRGIRSLLDSVLDYLPSPLDVPPVTGTLVDGGEPVARPPNPDAPLAALVYKVMNDENRNRLYYTRIYSGTVPRGAKIRNPRTHTDERITRIYRMHSNRKEALDAAIAGDIVVLVGPKKTRTGDTLGTPQGAVFLEPIDFPDPVISAAIEPGTRAELPELERALAEMAIEDPTFTVKDDPETGQKVISGMGELHLEVLVDRVRREFGIDARIGQPQVAYRETVGGVATATGLFDREIADFQHRAGVTLEVSPGARSSGFAFVGTDDSADIPGPVPGWVESAARDSLTSGPFAGYPMLDIRVRIVSVDLYGDASTEMAVRGATSDGFRQAATRAEPVLLEPVVRLEVIAPQEATGDVMRDLSARNATVTGIEARGTREKALATVPLSRMFGYATDLRSATRGRGTFSMEMSHYEPATEAMKRFRSGA
ncbi:MAG: elongation factor G [Gemmatimonadota bacterium]|jgi:elongation factor G|nr:elongation factor G [Gemmatimonadota bacterium]MDP7031839.1 elongation factor G [Gemmatimonadota bacterium]